MLLLLIVLILVVLILVTSFNSGSVLSPGTPRNNNASPTLLLKQNTLHYLRLLDKPNGILIPSSNSTSTFPCNCTTIINPVSTLHKTPSTTTKPNISILYITIPEAVSSTRYFSSLMSQPKTTLLIL